MCQTMLKVLAVLRLRRLPRFLSLGLKQVDVSKYQIEKQYVTLNGRDFRSFVMISLDPSNRVHGEEVNNFDANADAEANAAMDSL
jgi:hypothetical protein